MTKTEVRELKAAARAVTRRAFSFYNRDYIKKCVKDEPNSFLALVAKLKKIADKP